jgi:hypothetical protein
MARIARDAYPKIQHLVDVEGKKVAEVAASYGCTPANIYAILNKTRRLAGEASTQAGPKSPAVPVPAEADALLETPRAVVTCSDPAPPADLFADIPEQTTPRPKGPAETDEVPASKEPVASGEHAPMAKAPAPKIKAQERVAAPPSPAPTSPPTSRADRGPPTAARTPRGGARIGKGTGVALLMRTSDGEETAHPFRSLEELLSASKPILRSAARSSEPIWFSIQQVDLDAFAAEDF